MTQDATEEVPVKALVPPHAGEAWGDVWNRYDQNVTRAEILLPIPAPYDTMDYPEYKLDKFNKGNDYKPAKFVRNAWQSSDEYIHHLV